MDDKIRWNTQLDQALIEANKLKKPILLDFFNPE